MKKIMVLTLALILSLTLVPISSACAIKQIFENIVISSGIEEDTNEPLNENIEFEASSEHIYATIKFSGVKGGDNWRFKWTNLDTGETVLDKEDRYDMDQEEKYMEGIVETDIYPLDKSSLIPAGDYKVEFYNNGELVKTTTFKVNKPEVSIIEVLLANQVDQDYVPVSITQEFNSNETVYACVQVNYQTAGNTLKAQWKSSTDELIKEASIELAEFSSPSYITFWFPSETETLEAGSYKVEIYLNDILYGSFDFEVTEEVAEATVTFDQGNEYSATDFGFTITLPDTWTYEENKTEQDVSLTIVPPSQDIVVWLQFSAGDPELYVPFGDFAYNDSA